TPQRLLPVESMPDKIVTATASVQLPGLILWLDKELRPVRSQFKIPQLGTLVLYRCPKEVAQRRGSGEPLPDIAKTSLIPLSRPVQCPIHTRCASYCSTVKV